VVPKHSVMGPTDPWQKAVPKEWPSGRVFLAWMLVGVTPTQRESTLWAQTVHVLRAVLPRTTGNV